MVAALQNSLIDAVKSSTCNKSWQDGIEIYILFSKEHTEERHIWGLKFCGKIGVSAFTFPL
jgi:hypothetical protein